MAETPVTPSSVRQSQAAVEAQHALGRAEVIVLLLEILVLPPVSSSEIRELVCPSPSPNGEAHGAWLRPNCLF